MPNPGRWFQPRRVFAAAFLLAALIAGEVADAHHHMGEHGCASEAGARDDNCTCTGLHASPIASEMPPQVVPVADECVFPSRSISRAPRVRASAIPAPRAPPAA